LAQWRNWSGNQRATPSSIEHPRDADAVSRLVKRAVSEGRHVRVAGAGHSFTAAAVTDGMLLELDRFVDAVKIDVPTGLVTVPAGMTLRHLNRLLAAAGLALTNLGDIDRQTVAGGISTGTHGTGAKLGGIATQVRGLELVVGDASIVHCSATERPELFSVARVALGALGVITAVTLQCEPAFTIHADERPMKVDEVVKRLDELAADNEHFEFFWFPHTDVALVKQNNRLAAGEQRRPLRKSRAWLEDELVANGVGHIACSVGLRRPALVAPIARRVGRMLSARTYTAPSYEVFVSPRRVRFLEMEYAVPRPLAAEAFAAVRDVIERENLNVSFPVELRVAAADDIALSTACGRESAYIAVHMFRGESTYQRFFQAVEARMRELDGRPHWGKLHWRTAADLRPAYPGFEDFLRQRDMLDPARVFANPYLDMVLGG
jgi:L-gulono-1,4-lactone dehydrogenase